MAQELKYYHGEAENPYMEVNETQGAWCMRYNDTAAMLWDFEYWWANGWDKYSKLVGKNRAYFFELHKQPQKEYANMQEALYDFAGDNYSGILYRGCPRWVQYVYDNAHKERFYKPVHNVVPADEIPSYLHWYRGEEKCPYNNEPSGSTKGFWWDFEYWWYKTTEHQSKEAWLAYLHSWFVRCCDTNWDSIPPMEQERMYNTYIKGVPLWALQ